MKGYHEVLRFNGINGSTIIVSCLLNQELVERGQMIGEQLTVSSISCRPDAKWEDMPRCYGSYVTACRRLRRWSEEGVWSKILYPIYDTAHAAGKLYVDTVAVDSTFHRFKKSGKFSGYNGHKMRQSPSEHRWFTSELGISWQ